MPCACAPKASTSTDPMAINLKFNIYSPFYAVLQKGPTDATEVSRNCCFLPAGAANQQLTRTAHGSSACSRRARGGKTSWAWSDLYSYDIFDEGFDCSVRLLNAVVLILTRTKSITVVSLSSIKKVMLTAWPSAMTFTRRPSTSKLNCMDCPPMFTALAVNLIFALRPNCLACPFAATYP